MNKREIIEALEALSSELKRDGIVGEAVLVGGAVMCLAFDARESTKDVDAIFKPKAEVSRAAKRVAETLGLPEDWLNDAVKGFMGNRSDFKDLLEFPNLKVFAASPEYMLAMKCMAARREDYEDIRFLIAHLGLSSLETVLNVVESYYNGRPVQAKTRFIVEEILGR